MSTSERLQCVLSAVAVAALAETPQLLVEVPADLEASLLPQRPSFATLAEAPLRASGRNFWALGCAVGRIIFCQQS